MVVLEITGGQALHKDSHFLYWVPTVPANTAKHLTEFY